MRTVGKPGSGRSPGTLENEKLPFAMRLRYYSLNGPYAAVPVIHDAVSMRIERQLTESSSQSQHRYLPDREAASPADRIRYGNEVPLATLFRNIRVSLICHSVECLHHGAFGQRFMSAARKTTTPMLTTSVCSDSALPDSLHQLLRMRQS